MALVRSRESFGDGTARFDPGHDVSYIQEAV